MFDLLDSIRMLGNAMRLLADSAIAGLKVREERVREVLERNPILVTALNPIIGYEKAAAIAKRAYREGLPVLEVALEDSVLSRRQLKALLDPRALTRGGIRKGWGRLIATPGSVSSDQFRGGGASGGASGAGGDGGAGGAGGMFSSSVSL